MQESTFILSLALSVAWMLVGQPVQAQGYKQFWVASEDVQVLDGDTLYAKGQVIELSGIDAPEIGQKCDHNGHLWSCGMAASLDLKKSLMMARMSRLHCWDMGKTAVWTYATCYVGEKDLAAAMLEAGMAETTPQATPHYQHIQETVKQAGLGIWGSRFQAPEDWARQHKLSGEMTPCAVKAAKAETGPAYFATPLMPAYRSLKVTRTYCRDEDALLDGFIPAVQ